MKLGILIPTYWKKDDSTKEHLTRALLSIKNQTHQDYLVILIGDDYSNKDQFSELCKIIDDDKIVIDNLPIAAERTKYSGRELWVCGGVNASNRGIELGLQNGISWICHLDHDDWWEPTHLEEIAKAIETTSANFLTTRCTDKWPAHQSTSYYTRYRPLPSKVVKSTTCVNYQYFGFRFRNMIEKFKKVYASDADMWVQINQFLTKNNEWGCLIDLHTMNRGGSQTVIRNPEIIK